MFLHQTFHSFSTAEDERSTTGARLDTVVSDTKYAGLSRPHVAVAAEQQFFGVSRSGGRTSRRGHVDSPYGRRGPLLPLQAAPHSVRSARSRIRRSVERRRIVPRWICAVRRPLALR